MVQNQAVAEELAQEVFLRVYRSRGTYEPTAKFTTWLFRIATHLALNSLRDGKHEKIAGTSGRRSSELPARQVSDRQPSVEAVDGVSRPGWRKCGGRWRLCRRSNARRF